jgi:hypothetical protein
MVLFNYGTKEVTTKIVFYGPGLCGKTTNLKFIYDSLPSNSKSKMISLATNQDRTLFFDFLPLDLGTIKGMKVRLQLYTVPGQVYYNSTRQLVLKGADGVVFVADSQDFAIDSNLESWANLKENLGLMGTSLEHFPHVMQYNKRDLPDLLPVEELNARLNEYQVPWFEAIATTGFNVEATLKALTKIVLKRLARQYGVAPGEDISEKDIVLIPHAEPADPRKGGGSLMGNDKDPLEALWEKEEPADKKSFAFEGEEFDFEEISPPAPAMPGGPGAPFEDLPAPAAAPPAIPPAPPEPFGVVDDAHRLAGPEPGPFEEPPAPVPPRPFAPAPPAMETVPPEPPPGGTMADEGLPFEDFPAPPPPEPAPFESMPIQTDSGKAAFLDLAPAPVLGPPSSELEPAPLAAEKLERQMKAGKGPVPATPPPPLPRVPAPTVPAAGSRDLLVREVEVPVVISSVDLAGVTEIEFRIKLKVKIEP